MMDVIIGLDTVAQTMTGLKELALTSFAQLRDAPIKAGFCPAGPTGHTDFKIHISIDLVNRYIIFWRNVASWLWVPLNY